MKDIDKKENVCIYSPFHIGLHFREHQITYPVYT